MGNKPRGRKPWLYEAFGEWKTLKEWADDARCKYSYNYLRKLMTSYPWPDDLTAQLESTLKKSQDWAASHKTSFWSRRGLGLSVGVSRMCERQGVNRTTVISRIQKGMNLTDALKRETRKYEKKRRN